MLEDIPGTIHSLFLEEFLANSSPQQLLTIIETSFPTNELYDPTYIMTNLRTYDPNHTIIQSNYLKSERHETKVLQNKGEETRAGLAALQREDSLGFWSHLWP